MPGDISAVDADSLLQVEWNEQHLARITGQQAMGIPPRTYGALQVKLRESLVTRTLVMPIQQFIHIQGISSIHFAGGGGRSRWFGPTRPGMTLTITSGRWS